MAVRARGETPEARACVLAPASEDGFVMTVVDSDGVIVENDVAVGFATFANANEGVIKCEHDEARPDGVVWELGQVKLAVSG